MWNCRHFVSDLGEAGWLLQQMQGLASLAVPCVGKRFLHLSVIEAQNKEASEQNLNSCEDMGAD